MSVLTKILIWAGTVLTIAAFSFIVYKQFEISNRQKTIEESVVKQKDLVDGITRSQSEYATKKDVDQFAKDHNINVKAIQDDLSKLHAEVAAVNIAIVDSNAQHSTNVPTSFVGPKNENTTPPLVCKDGTPCPNTDPYNYLKFQQNLVINEDFGTIKIPFGSVGFSSWKKDPWNIDVKSREYRVSSVIGTDENERFYFYNKFSVNVDGKNYDLPIKTAETKQEYPEAKFNWWSPRLYLTSGSGVGISKSPIEGTVNVGVDLGVLSYGKFKLNPDISILQVGVGYQSNTAGITFIVNPINYNIGKLLPSGLVNNTFIGPSFQVSTNGSMFLGANLSVGL